jgi:hypothetical protein
MKKRFVKCVAWYLVAGMFLIGMAPRVDAGLSSSETVALPQVDPTSDLQYIQKLLETKMIRERLGQLGFSHDEIQARINQLNDRELHQLALSLDEIRVGGNGFAVLVVLLLVGILIGVWLHVTGRRVVIE